MLPLSRLFAEIHGVDVSDEMVGIARERLCGVPHAVVRASSGEGLENFDDSYFDFVYSYAVFQHIPSRNVVLNYLREARRVLKPRGILRCQLSGLIRHHARADTWSGVAFSSAEMNDFLKSEQWKLLALEGGGSQYMWITCRKPAAEPLGTPERVRIRRVTNAASSERAAPARGRFASIAIWIEGLPDSADLFHLDVRVAGYSGEPTYLGPLETGGLQQLNVMLPPGLETGLQPVEVFWQDRLIAADTIRIVPDPPMVPRILWFSDGVDLLSRRIVSGQVKIFAEEIPDPALVSVRIDGQPVSCDLLCTNPLIPAWEINLTLPDGTAPGQHQINLRAGRRKLPPVVIDVG
jgi:SAM-dependent methyltransferase